MILNEWKADLPVYLNKNQMILRNTLSFIVTGSLFLTFAGLRFQYLIVCVLLAQRFIIATMDSQLSDPNDIHTVVE